MNDVIERMLEVWSGGDPTAVADIYTDPLRLIGVERPRGDVVTAFKTRRAAFPDQH